jgi:hypothetical protein
LLRTAISIRENKLSSVTLLRRLGNHSRKNRLYRAFLIRPARRIGPDFGGSSTFEVRKKIAHATANWLLCGVLGCVRD